MSVKKAFYTLEIMSCAYFLPKQPLAPKENGCVASNMSFSLWSSHLSGENSSGDLKFAVDKLAATGFVDTMVCRYRSMRCPSISSHGQLTLAGKWCPSTVSPPSGTIRGRGNGSGA